MPHSPLLLQLVLILGTARLLSMVLRRLGQPPVIGEMTAGIVLGPIVLGALLPERHGHVTMLMVMAILTTFMTGTLLTLFAGRGDAQVPEARETVARP